MQAVKAPPGWINFAAACVSYCCMLVALAMADPFWAGFNACMAVINMAAALMEPYEAT